jgi:hypothetical protein
LSDSLGGWFAFLESVKRRAAAAGGGINFAGSALVFPGRDGAFPHTCQAETLQEFFSCREALSAVHNNPTKTTTEK